MLVEDYVTEKKSSLPNDNNLDEYKPVINICSKCKQEVGRGKNHKFLKLKSFLENKWIK